jgi:hypothetical protein
MRGLVVGLAIAAALAIARPAAAQHLPVVVEGGEISVRAEPGLDELAKKLHQVSGPWLERIAADLEGLRQPEHIEIRLVDDAASMQDAAPPGRQVPAWAAGVAFPDLGILVVAVRRAGRPLDTVEVLHHELAHLALGAALGKNAPHWLHEGFAYQHSAEWTWDRTETLAGMAWAGSTIPIEELDASFPAEELPANRAYAESYDFVGYLAKRGRYEDSGDDGDRFPFRRFLAALARDGNVDRAALHAYGRPLRDLFEEWKRDLTQRYMLIPAGLFVLGLWVIAALLLLLAFLRRRRQNRRRLAEWDRQEAEAAARARPFMPPDDIELGDERPPPTSMN